MSAWSDWKCGGITDEQYASACNREQSKCDNCEWLYKGICTAEAYGILPCEGEEE